jgi:long-chain acyl-CoA synthetase
MQEAEITIFVGVPQFFYLFYQSMINEIQRIPFFTRMLVWGLVNAFYKLRQLTGINFNKLLFKRIHSSFGDNLKYFVSGGAKLDTSVEIFLNKIGFTLIQGYGLTETAPIVTFNPLTRVKIGSVGKVVPEVSLKIIEPDANGVGEIAIC